MLWLALHFPGLPLNAQQSLLSCLVDVPVAVVERVGAVERICAVNAPAQAAGVVPGVKRAAALLQAADLVCWPRQPQREQALLELVADWAQQFTSEVSVQPPASVLLKIGGSLTYFRGLGRLRALVEAGIAELGLVPLACGCAPTPQAALWLAWAGRPTAVEVVEHLPAALDPLPIPLLQLPAAQCRQLHDLGVRHLGQLRALPAAGLAKRFGPSLISQLEQALGSRPDPRPYYQPPPLFRRRIELNWAAATCEPVQLVGQTLLRELAAFLQGRALAVQQVTLHLEHDDRPPSALLLGFGVATRQDSNMLLILRERLARFVLPAPVIAVGLLADQLTPLDGQPLELFATAEQPGDRELWLARLRARLGDDAVHGVQVVADHRPERAWQPVPVGSRSAPLSSRPRPAWLLAEPQLLPIRDDRPCWEGQPLYCKGRLERIEAGGWDHNATRRDYYRAVAPDGRWFWIYQDRRSMDWYLHGLFA